jgi:hypothetical protein
VSLTVEDTESGLHGEFVAVRMTDTGTGIAPDVLPNLEFLIRFSRRKRSEKGAALDCPRCMDSPTNLVAQAHR